MVKIFVCTYVCVYVYYLVKPLSLLKQSVVTSVTLKERKKKRRRTIFQVRVIIKLKRRRKESNKISRSPNFQYF